MTTSLLWQKHNSEGTQAPLWSPVVHGLPPRKSLADTRQYNKQPGENFAQQTSWRRNSISVLGGRLTQVTIPRLKRELSNTLQFLNEQKQTEIHKEDAAVTSN